MVLPFEYRSQKCTYRKQIQEERLDDAVVESIIKLVGNPKFSMYLKSITFKLPIIDEDLNICLDNDKHVENVVLMEKIV